MNHDPTLSTWQRQSLTWLKPYYKVLDIEQYQDVKDFVTSMRATDHRDSIQAIIFYGSTLNPGMAKSSSTPDYYVIVDRYKNFYGGAKRQKERRLGQLSCLHSSLNRLLPPSIYRFGESKYSVISLRSLKKQCSAKARNVYNLGRFSKRSAIAYVRQDETYIEIVQIIAAAMEQAMRHAFNLATQPLSAEDAMLATLKLSYDGEPRVEALDKIRRIFNSQEAYYRELFGKLLDQLVGESWLTFDAETQCFKRQASVAEQKASQRFIKRSRRDAIMRWPKYMFTVKNWSGYMLAKIERAKGIKLDLKPHEKRFPLIFGWKYFWQLRRKKMLK